VLDPDRAQVKISTPDGQTVTWEADGEIPVPFGNRAKLKVNEILRHGTR